MLINTIPTFLCNWFCVKNKLSRLFLLSYYYNHTPAVVQPGVTLSLSVSFIQFIFPPQSASSVKCVVGKRAQRCSGGNPTHACWHTRTHPTAATTKCSHRQEAHRLFGHKFNRKNAAGMRTKSVFVFCCILLTCKYGFNMIDNKDAWITGVPVFLLANHTWCQGQAVHTSVWR